MRGTCLSQIWHNCVFIHVCVQGERDASGSHWVKKEQSICLKSDGFGQRELLISTWKCFGVSELVSVAVHGKLGLELDDL